MSRIKRWFMRAPIGLYRVRLGWLLGRRFLLLEHIGRRSSLVRRVVLEVVESVDGIPVVASGYGETSDWCRNVTAHPPVAVTIGLNRFEATAVRLETSDAAAVLDRYRTAHPSAAKAIGHAIGVSITEDVAEAATRLPLFRLVPAETA